MAMTKAPVEAGLEPDFKTIVELFMRTADNGGAQDALVDGKEGSWRRITWAGYKEQASYVAMGLRALGVDHGDVVALMMGNRAEHVISDVGVLMAGGTPFSVYSTLTAEQVQYVASDSAAKVAIVENAHYRDVWLSIRDQLPSLEHIIVVDKADAVGEGVMAYDDLIASGRERLSQNEGEFENSWRAVKPEDPVTIIYTSGTTGPPKGVVLTNANMGFILGQLPTTLDGVPIGQKGLSYLPLAHIAERAVTHYLGIYAQGTIYFAPAINEVRDVLGIARPNIFMAVPRVWEKFHAAMMAALDEAPEPRKKLALAAIDAGRQVVRLKQAGKSVPFLLNLKFSVLDKIVLSKIRDQLGLDELRYAISGAAPISGDLLEFFAAIGVNILEVYGMTESTGLITANRPGAVRIGTVGVPVPGTEVAIAEDGEILARGAHVTPGYLNRAEATAEAIDDEGWLHTGDLGAFDEAGSLKIIGRKKELIITAGGKNLSPNNIEETIKSESTIIGQICALGDSQPFIGALVVLDGEAAPAWAAKNGIDATDLAVLSQDPKVVAEVQRAIDAGNANLARVEQVREFRILPSEWTAESEELTPTLKLKRTIIHDKYADVIGSIYGG